MNNNLGYLIGKSAELRDYGREGLYLKRASFIDAHVGEALKKRISSSQERLL